MCTPSQTIVQGTRVPTEGVGGRDWVGSGLSHYTSFLSDCVHHTSFTCIDTGM